MLTSCTQPTYDENEFMDNDKEYIILNWIREKVENPDVALELLEYSTATAKEIYKKYKEDPNNIDILAIEAINKEVKARGDEEEKVGFNLVHYVATCGPSRKDVYEMIREIFQKCAHNKEKIQNLINRKTENSEKREMVNDNKPKDNCSVKRLLIPYLLFINYNMLLIYGTLIS